MTAVDLSSFCEYTFTFSIEPKRVSQSSSLSFGNNRKSHGAESGECVMVIEILVLITFITTVRHENFRKLFARNSGRLRRPRKRFKMRNEYSLLAACPVGTNSLWTKPLMLKKKNRFRKLSSLNVQIIWRKYYNYANLGGISTFRGELCLFGKPMLDCSRLQYIFMNYQHYRVTQNYFTHTKLLLSICQYSNFSALTVIYKFGTFLNFIAL